MLNVLNRTKDWFLDVIFPRFCFGCGKEGEYICQNCDVFLNEIDTSNLEDSFQVMSIWEHEGLMKELFCEVKLKGRYNIIEELTEKAFKRTEFNLPSGTIISYVPLFKKKEKERGFNQSALIAQKLASFLGVSVAPLLKKNSDSELGLDPEKRKEKVKDTFEYCSSFLPENVLLVDDIYETGATAKACADILKKEGVKKVWIFTLSRKMSICRLPRKNSVL